MMQIGSGDVSALMAGIDTQAHRNLLEKFVAQQDDFYNAKASPIDALRTGAILEERFFLTLPENYFPQYKVFSEEMNVFRASLDFGKIEKGFLVDFIELKTVWFEEFFSIEMTTEYIRKNFKKYCNQIQEQLYCSGLDSCEICFLSVYSYDDETNYSREILPEDVKKMRIFRDEITISEIKERGMIFQQIKDYFNAI